jgi:membrane fusion protein, copper/silver efflux system
MKVPRIPASAFLIWKHTSAFIALVLIVVAFIVGVRLGNPSQPTATSTQNGSQNASSDSGSNDSAPQMYTCSMHPSVRLPDPDAKCPICFMDLIPVREGDSGDPNTLVLSESETIAARVETTRVSRFVPSSTLRLFGSVERDETSVERISAYFPGRVETLYANFMGSRVSKGDHLAEMYSPDLLAAFEELHQASRSATQSQSMSEIVRTSSLETLSAARERLRLYGIEESLIEQIQQEGYHKDTFTIDAPRGGTITHINIQEGEYVQTGTPIITIADLTHLWLDLQAFESQISQIRWGQRVSFQVESHPGQMFEGRVSFIDPIIDPKTRSAIVRVAVENPDRSLKPGMFASATIIAKLDGTSQNIDPDLLGRWVCPMHPTDIHDEQGECSICAMNLVPIESMIQSTDTDETSIPPLVVPSSAVLFTGTRSMVYTQIEDEKGFRYTPTQITLGQRAGEFFIVLDGLKENDRVVTKGAFRIDSSMQIAAKPSMMSMESDTTDTTDIVTSRPHAFKKGLSDSVNAYLDAQEALADDDLSTYNTHAKRLIDALDSVPTTGLLGEDLATWRSASRELRPKPSYDDIEVARADFEPMSNAIFALIERFGVPDGSPLHIAYCPMAFDFVGADWLQRTEEIDNPYFGSTMLRCGEILESIQPQSTQSHPAQHSPKRAPVGAPTHQHGGG